MQLSQVAGTNVVIFLIQIIMCRSILHWCRSLLLSFSTCYLGILGLEGAINCILAWTSHQRTTSEKRTKDLLPKCPLFGGSTVLWGYNQGDGWGWWIKLEEGIQE